MQALFIKYLMAIVAVAALGWWAYSTIVARVVEDCELRHEALRAKVLEDQHTEYIAAVDWGNQVSTQLASAQRQIATLKDNHEDYARDLSGTCPIGLRYLHDAAASGTQLSEAARASLGSPVPIDAGRIGEAVSRNYAACRDCQAQLNALIDWHDKTPQ